MACDAKMAIWQYGNMAIWQYGNMTIWQYDNMAIWQYGNMTIWQYGNMAIWQYGNMAMADSQKYPLNFIQINNVEDIVVFFLELRVLNSSNFYMFFRSMHKSLW